MSRLAPTLILLLALPLYGRAGPPAAVEIGTRREVFVDRFLIDTLTHTDLCLHRPIDRGLVFSFDKPWEGPFSGYVTILHVSGRYQAYYRGSVTSEKKDTGDHQVVCYAESDDGVHWTKPLLKLYPRAGQEATNIVLADAAPVTHNFCPFVDARPGVKPNEKYKAVGGYHEPGLFAYVSPDGVHWKRLGDKPVLTNQEVGFARATGPSCSTRRMSPSGRSRKESICCTTGSTRKGSGESRASKATTSSPGESRH